MTAKLNNHSALAGGLGAGGGELAARVIRQQMYPGKAADQLSESEKQQVSALSQLATGLAGGLATSDTAGIITAAKTGRNAVENNYLSSQQIDAWSREVKAARKAGADPSATIEKYEKLSTAHQKQFINDCASDPFPCQQKYGDVLGVRHGL